MRGYLFGLALIGFLMASPAGAQTGTSGQNDKTRATQADAIRGHIDEAEDLVDSLLRWKHVTTWSDQGKLDAPPPDGPAMTLISVDRADAQKVAALLDALAAQVPAPAQTTPAARGDLRAHVEKAQQIAKELLPPHAAPVTGSSNALVTIDRTSLERLEVELDAMETLLPRATR